IGFGLGVGQPLNMAWLAEAAPPGLRGRAMSLRMVGNRTGQLLIPTAAGLVAAGLGAAGRLWLTALGLGWAGLAGRRLPADPGWARADPVRRASGAEVAHDVVEPVRHLGEPLVGELPLAEEWPQVPPPDHD